MLSHVGERPSAAGTLAIEASYDGQERRWLRQGHNGLESQRRPVRVRSRFFNLAANYGNLEHGEYEIWAEYDARILADYGLTAVTSPPERVGILVVQKPTDLLQH